MIAELATHLLGRIRTVSAVATKTSLAIGGKSADPGLLLIPPPAVWVSLKVDISDEADIQHGPHSGVVGTSQVMMTTWAAIVFIPYTTEADLIAVQYPLLEDIVNAVHGTENDGGFRWRFLKRTIALVQPDRLAYEHLFTTTFTTNA